MEARYNEAMQQEIRVVEVWQGSCGNDCSANSGRIVTQWPHTIDEF